MTGPRTPRPDEAHFSPALLGFYGSCALVSAGAGMFFFATFALDRAGFGSLPLGMQVLGGAGMAIGVPGAFWCLAKARRGGPQR